ncbi:MAG: cation:H+ antiporter [Gaiellales bacterium]|nr:cation:H+ antiporter [Gaiellales bacterium]
MSGLGTPVLVVVFVVAAAATWGAGVYLAKTTHVLDHRFGLGEALGGLILLAVTGSLPEIAITASAAMAGHLDLAVGNLIGGVAMQTLVLVVLDVFAGRKRPLSFLVGSLVPVLEALMVVIVLATALGGAALSPSTNIRGASPTSIAVVILWVGGVWVVNRVRLNQDWEVNAPHSRPGRRNRREPHPAGRPPFATASTGRVLAIFVAGSVVTLGAGVTLQASGSLLADRMNVQGAIFGATFLAAATALPEISSGIAAVRLGDMQLAVGDILGGNSFQICLFLLADLLAGRPVIGAAHTSDIWLGGLGLMMTGIAAAAIIARPKRTFVWLGIDSVTLLVVYALAIGLLPRVA